MTATIATAARVRTWTPVHTDGYHCDRLEFTLDHGEHQRRQAAGLGAFTNLGWLGLLMELPSGHPVPWTALSDYAKRTMPKWPPGVVEFERSGRCYASVTSQLTRPAMDCLALVYGKRFALGHMGRASQFAPMGRRGVVYTPAQAEKADAFVIAQYDFYGVGIGAQDGGGVRWLLEPAAYRPMRFTAAAWWFAETVYAQWLEHGETS